jgi:hypothetical protein
MVGSITDATKPVGGAVTPTDLWERLLRHGNIAVVVGRRGSGKSAMGVSVAEEASRRGRDVYLVGFPENAGGLFPQTFKITKTVEQVPNGAFALLDEAVLLHSSRSWHSNQGLTRIVDLARQKDLSLVFVTLNTAMIDANILRAIDTLVIKEPSLLQEYMERPWFKKFLTKASLHFDRLPEGFDHRAWAYIFDSAIEGMVKVDLPSFWNDEISKMWKDYSVPSSMVSPTGKIDAKKLKDETLCYKCELFAWTEKEGWCILGHDVPVIECKDFQPGRSSPKTIIKTKTPPKWFQNPPVGVAQCHGCIHGYDSEGKPFCTKLEKVVRKIEGTCPYREV